jgi:hypothetical protein
MSTRRAAHSQDVRTYPAVAIEVVGLDRQGRSFTERTNTINTSLSACRFPVKEEIVPESVISIRLVATRGGLEEDSRPALFQVSRTERTPRGWILDAWRLQPDASWAIALLQSGAR